MRLSWGGPWDSVLWGLGGARGEPGELWAQTLFPSSQATGLHFRHTDNINFWLAAIAHVGLPSVMGPQGWGSPLRPASLPRALATHTLSLPGDAVALVAACLLN